MEGGFLVCAKGLWAMLAQVPKPWALGIRRAP